MSWCVSWLKPSSVNPQKNLRQKTIGKSTQKTIYKWWVSRCFKSSWCSTPVNAMMIPNWKWTLEHFRGFGRNLKHEFTSLYFSAGVNAQTWRSQVPFFLAGPFWGSSAILSVSFKFTHIYLILMIQDFEDFPFGYVQKLELNRLNPQFLALWLWWKRKMLNHQWECWVSQFPMIFSPSHGSRGLNEWDSPTQGEYLNDPPLIYIGTKMSCMRVRKLELTHTKGTKILGMKRHRPGARQYHQAWLVQCCFLFFLKRKTRENQLNGKTCMIIRP